MVHSVQVVMNALLALAKPTVVVPRESRQAVLTATPVATAPHVQLITTSPTRSATRAMVGRQVQLDPHQNYLA